jgi:hypothetical protein
MIFGLLFPLGDLEVAGKLMERARDHSSTLENAASI